MLVQTVLPTKINIQKAPRKELLFTDLPNGTYFCLEGTTEVFLRVSPQACLNVTTMYLFDPTTSTGVGSASVVYPYSQAELKLS